MQIHAHARNHSDDAYSHPTLDTNPELISRPSLLTSVSGAAGSLFRSRHSIPSLSLAAVIAAAMIAGPTYADGDNPGSESSSESSGEGSDCGGGGCDEEDDSQGGSEGVDPGEGEVCQDEPECPCDSGQGDSGTQADVGGAGPLRPVAWDTGEKWEQVSDLYVKVNGKDFQITRQYSSNPDVLGDLYGGFVPDELPSGSGDSIPTLPSAPSVGTGWAFSNLRGVTYRERWGCASDYECNWIDPVLGPQSDTKYKAEFVTASAWMMRPGRKPRKFDINSLSGTGTATMGGSSVSNAPGNQGIVVDALSRPTANICLTSHCDTEPVAVPIGLVTGTVTFQEPGQWYQNFSISNGVGWISSESDEYGNTRMYDDTDSDGLPNTIYLNGTDDTDSEAWIDLFWEGTTANPLLVRAEVWRPGDTASKMTQYVEYYHLANDGTNDVIKYHDGTSYTTLKDPSNSSVDLLAADDLGTVGDLVQVVKYVAVDPEDSATDWRSQVTQYRYHDSALSAPFVTDIRLDTIGEDNQLKMVFNPQQLEFIAQARLSGTSLPGSGADMVMVDEASKLLAIEDDATAESTSGVAMYEVAAKIVSYDRDRVDGTSPVERQFLQATSCGCGGGATSAILRTYEQIDGWTTTVAGTPDIEGESMHMHEYEVTSFTSDPTSSASNLYRTHAFDMLRLGTNNDKPYVWMKTLIEGPAAVSERGGTTARSWVTRKVYDLDKRTVTGMQYPSRFSSYTKSASNPLTPPSTSAVIDGGYAESYDYPAGSENVGDLRVSTLKNSLVESKKVSSTTYLNVAGEEYRDFLPASKTRFRSDTGAENQEVVTYDYGFESTDSAKLDWRSITIERELVGENGEASALDATWYEFYDNRGKLIWEVDPDQTLTRYEYDYNTGVLVKVVRNSELPSSLTTPSDTKDPLYATLNDLDTTGAAFPTSFSGTPLTTVYTVDHLGRRTGVTRPGEVESSIVREMREDSERPGILYFAKVTLPHEIASSEFNRPATVRWYDADFSPTRASTYELDASGSSYAYGINNYGLGTELSRTATVQDLSGSGTKRRSWWELGESHEAIHETVLEFDAYGRVSKVTDAEGSVTQNTHDAQNRVIEAKVGTITSTPVTVAKFYFDGDPNATPPEHGVGNGNMTGIELFDGEGGSARITRMYYDGRDRLIGSVTPDASMGILKYDNLDRVVEEAVYPEPSGVPSLSDITTLSNDVPNTDTTYGDRAWHSVIDYSQRGMIWRQRTAIDPDSISTTNYLDSLYWYDAEGNEIAAWGPNAPMMVYEYDEHDRVSKISVSDRLTEAGGTLNYANATSVSGDTVLEEAEYTYNDPNGGVLEMIKSRMRVHDATATGALTDADAVTSYLGLIYDDALRQVATVNFGTNKTDFADGTTAAPTLSSYDTLAELRSATDVLFSWQEFNSRGMVDQVVAMQSGTSVADEIRTKYLYDDLYRTFAVVENYDDASLAWDTSEGRYVATGLDFAEQAEDRITSFVHDKVNKVTKRVAHLPTDPSGESAQITQYEYGVSAGSTSNAMDSLIASNNLLSRVRYPDESTGEPGASSKYYVDYAFNRLGELRGVLDQNQTTRTFERDEQGRVLADIVDDITTHTGTNARNIDGTIRRISYGYDTLGRMTSATSHTSVAASGNIRDGVEIAYTPLWQVEKIYQQHDGAVNTGTSPYVEYTYENAAASGATNNYSRLTGVRYPTDSNLTRDTVKFSYDSGIDQSGIDDRISRVSKLKVLGLNGSTSGGSPVLEDLIGYDRLGVGVIAKATVGVGAAGWDAVLDRTVNHDGSSTSGAYPAFDRFGRVVSHMWVRDDFTTYAAANPGYTGSYTGSNQPAYMEVTHSYDRSSNRLTYNDNRQGAKLPGRNRAFSYDRLNRLTEELRTPTPTGSVYTPQHTSRQWDLDVLGNWTDTLRDADNDGVFTDYEGTNYLDGREHNMANEIESGLQYDQRLFTSGGGTPVFFDHIYDDNGNMTDERQGTALPLPGSLMAGQLHTYDAWNRLVKTEYVPTSGSSTDISVNTYNALGWRTTREFDDSTGAFDGLDQKRLYFYGADWRMLEERIDTDVTTDSGTDSVTDNDTDWIGQQFWGIRYIDDAVGKRVDRDGNGNFTDADASYWYQLTDTQFSVGVVLDGTGNVYERIEYDAYGVARQRYGGDSNGDGTFNFFDISGFFGGGVLAIDDEADYHADFDVNNDGNIDVIDIGILGSGSPSKLPDGWVSDPSSTSGPDNSIGYAGYVFNHEREDYSVRHRNYNPELGRWMQRDPIGYKGGPNLFEYVMGHPINYVDPSGLERSECNEQLICRVAEAIARDCPGLAARQALAELAAAGLTPAEIGLALKGGAAAGGIGAALTSPRSGSVRSGDGRAMAYRSAGRGSSALRGVGRGFGAAGLGLGGYATYSEYAQGDSEGGAIAATSTAASGLFVTGGVAGMGTAGGLTGVVSTSGAATGTLAVAGAVGAGVGVVGLGVAIYLASELDATWDEIEEMASNPETNGRCNFLANEYNKARARCRNE
jgi:RHS repeat-associated protein